MLLNVSDFLRKFAEDISVEVPRVAERNKLDVNGDPMDLQQQGMLGGVLTESDVPEKQKRGPGAPMKPGIPEEAPHQTGGPNIRAPRRQPAHARKWNPGTRRQNMREYMQEYRGTGRINERKPQTNP